MVEKIAYKSLIKGSIARIAPLVVMLIFLIQLQGVFSQTLFTNRLDESGAIGIRYSFHALPFQCRASTLNFSGQTITLLNVSTPTRTYYLYSLEAIQIKSIGSLNRNNQTILIVWTTPEAIEEKDYVISGKFLDFHAYGTGERIPLLRVEDYHEFGILDSVVSDNRLLLSQIAIGMFALIASCFFATVGLTLWLLGTLEQPESSSPT